MDMRSTITPSFDTNFPILSTSSRSFPLGRETRQRRAMPLLRISLKPLEWSLTVLAVFYPLHLKAPVLRARVNSHPEILEGLQTGHHRTIVNPLCLLSITILSPPTDVAMPSRQPVTAASEEGTIDGRDSVLEEINPSRGLVTGGMENWIEGSNFPTGSLPLYARFGDDSSRAVGILLVSF